MLSISRSISNIRTVVNINKKSSEFLMTTVPQGSISGPLLFNRAVNSCFQLPFHDGTFLAMYADDTILVRDIAHDGGEMVLREDAHLLLQHFRTLGLHINVAKTRLMLASHAPSSPRLEWPLLLDGERVQEVESLRYLGVLVDRRLSFCQHWAKTAASAKAALAAVGGLVNWEPRLLRFLIRERVLPLLLFSLAPCAPTTAESWRRVDGVLRYAAHRLLNRWDLHGEELLDAAGLPSARALAASAMVHLARSCVFSGRRLGQFLDFGLSDAELPARPGLRSQSCLPPEELRPLLLAIHRPRYRAQERLLPHRLSLLWRATVNELGSDEILAAPSKNRLDSLLPRLLPILTPLLH